MRISDWSSDVCSSDLELTVEQLARCLKLIGDLFGAGGPLALDQTKRRAVQIEQIVDINGAVAEGILKCECIAEREGGCIDNTLQFGAHLSWRRSEERRVGKEGVSTCKSRGSPDL